jgi:type IV secretion system protein VirB4
VDPFTLLLGGALGAGAAALLGHAREHRATPAGLADLLNWGFLVDEGVVLQKDGALLAALRYQGPDLASATPAELDALHTQLNDALLPYGTGWLFHVDAVRTPATLPPGGAFTSPVAAWIDAERREQFRSARPQFVTECVLTATYLPPRDLYARAARAFVQGGEQTLDWHQVLTAFGTAITALTARLGARLVVTRLGSDALVTHLHRCLTGRAHAVTATPTGAYLNTVLASEELVGGFAPRIGDRHLRMVSIIGYPARSTTGRLDALGALPFGYRWSNRFIPVDAQAADRLLKRHQQRWFMGRKGVGAFLRDVAGGDDPAAAARRDRQGEELFYDQDASAMARDAAAALAENASGRVRFGLASQVVVIAEPSAMEADARARAVVQVLQDRGFPARIETVNALDAFLGTLPGHGYQNLRRPVLSTANVVDLWPVTSVWPGLPTNPSPLFPASAPPLTHVATDGATPFRLNLHVGDVGHTLVVGATGAGKSTLIGLLTAQWQRYRGAQTFVFDVGQSHRTLAQAVGGRHYDVGAGRLDALAFQPLADIDQSTERAWAVGWLEILLELQGVVVTPLQRTRLERALRLLADEPRPFRTLTELTVQLQDAVLAEALRPYTVGSAFGQLLDANNDALASDAADERDGPAARHEVYELRHLLDLDDRILVPVLLYLFRRVERRLDGRPTLIVIEELWAPLMRTVFANRIRQWLLTLRKQNAAVVLVAHTPAQLDAVPAKQVLVESCPTRILCPNPEAAAVGTAPLYRELGLNDREIARLAQAVPKRDYYVASPLGRRLVTLELGPVALAFLGTPSGYTPDAARQAVESLVPRHGSAWPAAWLAELGIVPPSTDATPATPAAAAAAAVTARDRTAHTSQEETSDVDLVTVG